MQVAIMQPYFFPYIGYFQLIGAADVFVVYDNIKYTKKGWINRNRILQNGKEALFSIPLKKAPDSLDVTERELAETFNRNKLLNVIEGAYRRAPYFRETFPLVERVVNCKEDNLFRFLYHSITVTCDHLGVRTEIRVSSSVDIDHGLKSLDKVLALCEALGATTYVNAIGGVNLYSSEPFAARGIDLKFLRSKSLRYAQFGGQFVPSLSIIDVLMFNPLDTVKDCLVTNYELLNRVQVEEAR